MRWVFRHSLRARLLGLLSIAVVISALAQCLVAYRTALAETDQIFDYQMQQMALSLRPGLPVGPDLGNSLAAEHEDNFDFVVQVWTADGLRIFQSTSRAQLPQRAVLGFTTVQARGTSYRLFSVAAGSQVIQVAQDLAARREMARNLALRTVSPIALMMPLLMLVVWWVISASLAPVERVRRQVASRQAEELGPLGEEDLPEEIRPLVQELNLLFHRVGQAFDAQKNFVADAAHELRSPLAALKLQVQGLRRASDVPARELAVNRLSSGIDRATRLVDQLLVLARQQASSAAGEHSAAVALSALVRQAVADLAAQATPRQIELGLTQADECRVAGQEEALRIMLRNLIDNALKYTPAGGTVRVAVRCSDHEAIFSVDDSGPGIAKEDRERVLDRFYRIAGAQGSGSGLGLAIVKTIAELHHASLSLGQSEDLGGLQVRVAFPLVP